MNVVLVNVPKDEKKKSYDDAFPFCKTLNFGILSIASYLKECGIHPSIFDPQSLSTQEPLEELGNLIQKENPLVIGLSCISGFSYPTFKKYAIYLKTKFPNIPIIGGGQNHIGSIAYEGLK